MKILAVVNPISGGENKEEFLDYFKNTTHKYGVASRIFKTTGEDDFSKLSKVIEEYKPDLVLAIGGDGTFALSALTAAETDTNVATIPLGSANAMSKELGVNQNPEIAFDDLLKSRMVKKLDVIDINNRVKCIHLADIGINARVVKSFEEDENRGMFTYGKHLARELRNAPPLRYSIQANDKQISGECIMIIIANGRDYGTGVSVTESGNPFDGLFEVVIVKKFNLGTIVKAGLSLIDELYAFHGDSSEVITTKKATISFEKPQLLQVDGEVIDEFESLEINMLAEHINFQATNVDLYNSVNKQKPEIQES